MKYFLLLLISLQVYAKSGADLLQGGSSKYEVKVYKEYKAPKLDNVFMVQAYGSYRALSIDKKLNQYFDLFFAGDNMESLAEIKNYIPINESIRRLLVTTKMYSFWKLDMFHAFFNLWKKESFQFDFSRTELGVALDELIGGEVSKKLVGNGVFLSADEIVKLKKIKTQRSKINQSIQTYFALQDGVNALDLLAGLDLKDPMFIPVVKTIVTDLAGKGELATAAKIIKEKLEPRIELESDKDIISDYYLLLARLLYQAKAYEASSKYYSYIPDTSRFYMTAQSERMWNSFMMKDYARLLGEYKTLKMKEFEHFFTPDTHVLGAMANLKLCYFEDVNQSFNAFINANKIQAQRIKDFFDGKITSRFNTDSNFKIDQLNLYKMTFKNEIERRNILFGDVQEENLTLEDVNKSIQNEIIREYQNAQKILEASLRRMRFAKIEYLSTMRRLKVKMAQNENKDQIHFIESGLEKDKKIVFPFDGVIFGDELFHYNSRVKKLCKAGL